MKRSEATRAKMRAAHAYRRPVFDADMARVAIAGYHANKSAETVAEEVGVGRDTLRRFWREQGLPPRPRFGQPIAGHLRGDPSNGWERRREVYGPKGHGRAAHV